MKAKAASLWWRHWPLLMTVVLWCGALDLARPRGTELTWQWFLLGIPAWLCLFAGAEFYRLHGDRCAMHRAGMGR